MPLLKITSPHAHGPTSTSWVMLQVILAAVPGIIVLCYFFGFGIIINLIWAIATALICEASVLKLRKRPIAFYLRDLSATVTAVLLAVALPPYAPWWLVVIATSFAILIAKHLYGGMGYNPFNPAMVAYVVMLISLPVEMTQWAAPINAELGTFIGPVDALLNSLGFINAIDGHTMATPLDLVKQNKSLMMEQLWQEHSQFGWFAGKGWETANLAFLIGGLYLLWRKIFTWHTPISLLVTLGLLSCFTFDGGSSNSAGSPLFHLFSGATMFGAFFIATDPVSSAVSTRGRIVFGCCIGVLIYIIRVWGSYPDAVAFAVLLMNFAAPFIDHYTQPTTYGYGKKS